MQNGVRVKIRGLKLGTELGLGFNSTAMFLRLLDSALCLTGIFKPIIHTISTYATAPRKSFDIMALYKSDYYYYYY